MRFRNVINDGSSNEPRIRLQQRLSEASEIHSVDSLAGRLDGIAAGGFGGIEASCQSEHEADSLATLLSQRQMSLGFLAQARVADDLLPAIELAHRARAQYFTVKVTGFLRAAPEIADCLEDMYVLVNESGFPLFIELGPGLVTQDLRRTNKLIRRFKKVRFSGNCSHYIRSALLQGTWSEDVGEHLQPVASRVGDWFAQDAQGDVEELAQLKKLWTTGMLSWLAKAQGGDVLPVTFASAPAPGSRQFAEEAWQEALASCRTEEASSDQAVVEAGA
jgi:hypothetical protein